MDINTYRPRDVFVPLHNRTARWACVVAHRRAGKTMRKAPGGGAGGLSF